MIQYIEKEARGDIMNISDKTIQKAMRIVGTVILVLSVALMVYLAWITGNVGLDMFLFMSFGVGVITMIGGATMIYLSYRVIFEEREKAEPEYIYTREPYMLARRCS